ncbi:DUF349 domain-containing protein [Microbacterium sp. No. 7]|uniref:DUF349 domain-containing protein n=1 Tax=Microbacterium sp. No. 7 TaxID=1714373 RepID=UPI002FFA20B4
MTDDAISPESASSETPAGDSTAESEAAPATENEAVATADSADPGPWGRVDPDGTVSVREGDQWRVVGQYPDGTPEEALAYFERKYADLAGEVTLLEVRYRRGGRSASDLRSTVKTVRGRITDAAAVGDLAALHARLDALESDLSEASVEEQQAQREALAAAVAERTGIVEQMEAIAARDPQRIQWKQTSADVTALFEQWQRHQAFGPRLPKSTAQQLWKRFRDARSVVDKHRREFYASLDAAHKNAQAAKTRLIERAEALASRGEDGIPAYRALLDEWKSAGRAGRKADDALWVRFKAAGDVLYGARTDRETAENEASKEKIDAKRALLDEAAAIGTEKDVARARALLTSIQRRWDDLGRIYPRETERSLDDQLRKVEQAVKSREDAEWKASNPETKARQNDMTQQLRDAIAKLEAELVAAQQTGDRGKIARAQEALDARKAWLTALGGNA